jgi:dihydrofolate reductase
VFIATSLDGFIARENGDLDWLTVAGREDGEDYGYRPFMARIDAVVMGRKTFEKVLTFPGWPFGTKPVIVLTRRPLKIPRKLAGRVETMSGPPRGIVERLAKRGIFRLYIDGGRTIQGFLEAGLIDDMTITKVPVLLGSGIPLFGPLKRENRLRHKETTQFADGLVQSTYEVVGETSKGSDRSRKARSRRRAGGRRARTR